MSRKSWTQSDREELVRLYPVTSTKQLAKYFQCTIRAIYTMAQTLNLNKSPEYLTTKDSGRILKNERKGPSTEFQRGHIPHNKGIRGWQAGGGAEKTKFKPGQKPHNTKPIGSIRVNFYGYLQRKMTCTGKNSDWVYVHHLLWKEHHGSIPKGHIVTFKNGDKTDICIENLQLLSRSENLKQNSVQRFPEKLKEVMRLKASLTRYINQKGNYHEKQD